MRENYRKIQYVGNSDELLLMAKRIDIILEASGDEILHDAGRITAEFAKEYAEAEFEKYRVIQDRLFASDFDKLSSGMLPELPFEEE